MATWKCITVRAGSSDHQPPPRLGFIFMQILGNTAARSPGRRPSHACFRQDTATGQKSTRTSSFHLRWMIPGLWGIARSDHRLHPLRQLSARTGRIRPRAAKDRDSAVGQRSRGVRGGDGGRRAGEPGQLNDASLRTMPVFLASSCRSADGAAHRGDARGRYVHRFELHADWGT